VRTPDSSRTSRHVRNVPTNRSRGLTTHSRLLRRRDQSAICCNDPAVAPTRDRVDPPNAGTASPRIAIRTPSGPPSTAVPPRTSRTVQPSIMAFANLTWMPSFGRLRPSCFVRGPATKHGGKPTKPFSQLGEDTQKQTDALMTPDPTMGCDHVGPRSQRDLSPVPSSRPPRHLKPGGKAMTEAITATCIFFSISVFLAHAFDAYRMR
jgi:hypothetical protein